MRMLGRFETPGCCPRTRQGWKRTRQTLRRMAQRGMTIDCSGAAPAWPKRAEQREFARSLLPEADAGWLRTLGPCFTDAGIDCAHGCNGDCVVSGSERCTFACHPERSAG